MDAQINQVDVERYWYTADRPFPIYITSPLNSELTKLISNDHKFFVPAH